MPWNEKEAERTDRKLKIGIIWDDGVVEPTPPVTVCSFLMCLGCISDLDQRAMKQATSVLQRAGHSVVELPAEEIKDLHRRGTSCVMKSNVQSGGHGVLKHIEASGEPVVPRTATGSQASFLNTAEVFQNHVTRAELSSRYNELWLQFNLDAILVPAVAHPAPPHGKYISNSYAGIYNMLDYATGSVPVTMVDLKLDVAPKEWYERKPYPRIEKDLFPYDWGDEEMKELYRTPQDYANSPVGVQIVCRRLKEEKLVGILKEVEALLKANDAQ